MRYVGAAIVVSFSLIPISIGIALLRSHLWDIDILISRTLIYGALTAIVVGLYILIVGYLGTLLRTGGNLLISLAATGLIAVLFQPLRGWLQRGVNRLLYGQRDEPYAVVARLGRRLEGTLAPDATLAAIVETLAQALKLPYAAITLAQDADFETAAVYGVPVEDPLTLPLSYHAEPVGELVLGPRQRGDTFTPTDRRLLEDLARQVGIAAHAVRLTSDLQHSRERLVLAREEERRRLRRDLHDGLGPTLAALALKASAVGELIPDAPDTASALASELTGDLRATIGEIRRLVYALRPPVLDELGLLAALRECAEQYRDVAGAPVMTLLLPARLPPLPAAVEVAALRITQEALTNTVRHAGARTCAVEIACEEGSLTLSVSDDGAGLPEVAHVGVGLRSMRERAEELGGSCAIASAPGGGLRVDVSLPLASLSATAVAPVNTSDGDVRGGEVS
jgi:signal transduction histidine kinase